ncbi:unnamed protein product [Phytophthora fragariaefolia]|uniref:Unnamed protein product n=1 Tax=Phytophthora fragariaefolia TaxID=1490495 RepID=A0A9W6Y4Z4_9STRA|nr:unnamed protein product [Phytophthora fragariaefolia]
MDGRQLSACTIQIADGDLNIFLSDGDSGVNALSNELLADKGDNLNVIDDERDAAEYGVMDSGDDAEKDDLDVGEDQDESTNAHASDDDEAAAATEEAICAEMHFAQSFRDSFGGEDQILAGNFKSDVLRSMAAEGWKDVVEPDTHDYPMTPYEPANNTSSYPGLRHGYSGPTPDALRNAESPLAPFFFFMPVALWQHIAVCSNQYGREMIHVRIDEQYKRYCSKRRYNPDLPRKTKHDIKNELEGTKPILPHELCRFVGLLIARTIAPNREKLAHHWKTTVEGAISRGAFGSVLRRDRFMEISRNLHFNPNGDPRAATYRAWKIRKVVEVLQRTFERGYVAPAHLAFDEAILPSRSSFNKMRVYIKDKPPKWGTKLFMLCSAVTADAHKTDMKSGPAAVVRNLLAVFGRDARKQGMRLVVADRFYTSVALAIQLLWMGFYCVGTIKTNHLGYCEDVIEREKSGPATITRGSFKIAKSKLVPNMAAISWWDSRPVHFLCTGGSLEVDRVVRQDRAGQVEGPCPRIVKDYHVFIGGVDVHDQLRLQRYSIQRAVRFRKYYKSLVRGLIDLAIVNGYIVHKAYHKNMMSRPLTHVKYMKKLHLQLCQCLQQGGSDLPMHEATPPNPRSRNDLLGRLASRVAEWQADPRGYREEYSGEASPRCGQWKSRAQILENENPTTCINRRWWLVSVLRLSIPRLAKLHNARGRLRHASNYAG